MTGPGLFLCGCDPVKKLQSYKKRRFRLLAGGSEIEVCPEHDEPMYGFLTPTRHREGLGRGIDFTKKGSVDRGKWPKLDVIDTRDLRTTEQVLADRAREKAMISNGHGGN